MRISLLKDDKLLTYKLPERVDGNFWLSEIDNNGIERNIINVEASPDGKWRLTSNADYYVSDNSKRVQYTLLGDDNLYIINHSYSLNNLLLFTSPDYDYKMKFYSCTKDLSIGLSFGRNNGASIRYVCSFVGVKDLRTKIA